MAKIKFQSPKVLKGITNVLENSTDILTFQRNGVIKIKHQGPAVKRPGQYGKRRA